MATWSPVERPTKLRKTEHVNGDLSFGIAPAQQITTSVAREGEELNATPSGIQDDPASSTVSAKAAGGMSDGAAKSLSKNQQKKLRRRQEWEAKEPLRKAKKKEQRKAKKKRDRARRANEDEATKEARAAVRKDAQLLPITVIFDCSYDDLMYEKEIVSLGSQLTRCYSENRNAKFKAHLVVSSFGGRLKDRFETVMKGSYKSWGGFTFTDAAFDVAANQAKEAMEVHRGQALGGAFAATQGHANGHDSPQLNEEAVGTATGETIYLSSDSDYTLTELNPYSTYIIGGLVDRNRYKGRCHRAAAEKAVKTARLPIGEYLEMSTRHILTTNHVLEIMLRWLELRDWGAAFTAVIPKRKGGVLKGEAGPKLSVAEADCVIEESAVDSDEESNDDDPVADPVADVDDVADATVSPDVSADLKST